MNIEGLGEKTVRQLVDRDLIRNIADLYELTIEDILQLDGFAKKSAQQLHRAINNSKQIQLDRFLYALGIHHVGEHVARVLAGHFDSLDKIRDADLLEIQHIPEIGPEIAASITEFFSQKENIRVLERLAEYGISTTKGKSDREKLLLRGKTFVFTGGLKEYTRSQAKRLVEGLGGRASTSVSGQTDFVVAGADTGSKLKDAKKHRVKILNEEQFEKMIQSEKSA